MLSGNELIAPCLFTIKTFKSKLKLLVKTMNEIFHARNEGFYETQQKTFFHIPSINVFSVAESVRFLGQKIWDVIPNEIKYPESKRFKIAIKKWKSTSCRC